MNKKRTFGEGLSTGNACILVKEKGLEDRNHPFWQWLRDEGFKMWLHHGHYDGVDWVFINLDSMICAPGMPGIRIAYVIRDHAVSIEDFKTIWGIYMKYEGSKLMDMTVKVTENILLKEWYEKPGLHGDEE